MDVAGPGSEYIARASYSVGAEESLIPGLPSPPPVPPDAASAPVPQPQGGEDSPPVPVPPAPVPQGPPLPATPAPPALQPPPVPAAPPGTDQARPAGSTPATIFRVERERLAALADLNRQRIHLVLWLLVIGVALGFLLLVPSVRTLFLPPPFPPAHPLPRSSPPIHRSFWPGVLFWLGAVAPLLALAVGLLTLPLLLWREVWLRRQRDLHLAIGRQGLLFFLPGRPRHWFLLPWGHITAISDATVTPRAGRRARLRTVLWRRMARLHRAFFRRGHWLSLSPEPRPAVRSPFMLHARRQQPRQRLRVACYARLPNRGYGWLFRLAPFTPTLGPSTFLLETGWFEPARVAAPAQQPKRPAVPGTLHRLLLGLWGAALARAQRPALPLPRSDGAVIVQMPRDAMPDLAAEARQVDLAAWAALPLVPALSMAGLGIVLVLHQPLERVAILNAATLVALAVGLGLVLAGVRWARRGWWLIAGATLLVVASLLNLAYGLVAFLEDWPWAFHQAPGEPFLLLEALAGLLIALGAGALALEGAGRPGARSAAGAGTDATLGRHLHASELALALGLLALGIGRVLEDMNWAVLSSGAGTLQFLRDTLAEPLLPLAIIGLSYFAPLAGPALQTLFRSLQMLYGLALALLVPASFIFVYRVTGGSRLVPRAWLPLLALALVCGLTIAGVCLWSIWRARSQPEATEAGASAPAGD